ncbi:hypothetical protein [Priestia megaterium]|uniref:hypothetical protein n=1 Tax=Priestia megaterium TaxID=1404 RepID=UPI001EDBCF53|nr:hypothetical protein [Priestia megaterium]MCM3305824.1 hypothetical protein [Priestia megaterium]UKJ82911.1 hypothetical protein H1W83_11815 [Priestia megaterium]
MNIISKFDNCAELKSDIEKYISLLTTKKEFPSTNELKSIAKGIILLKTVAFYDGESHYKNSMIFDILAAVDSLTGNSLRQFNYVIRSFIENAARTLLDLSDDDETGVNQLFKNLTLQFGSTEERIKSLDYINGEYGKSCMYVHSNRKANISIPLYYSDFMINDDFNRKNLLASINRTLLLVRKVIELFIYSNPYKVENAFFRNKQKLSFLLGDRLYTIFKQEIAKADTHKQLS